MKLIDSDEQRYELIYPLKLEIGIYGYSFEIVTSTTTSTTTNSNNNVKNNQPYCSRIFYDSIL